MTTLIDLLEADGHQAKWIAATDGGEYAGACPSCGGSDRFRVWPDKGRWWCRSCDDHGDTIDYLRKFRNLTYPEACRAIGRDPGPMPTARPNRGRPPWIPKAAATPADAWQEKARAFVSWSQQQLSANADIMAWLLTDRGLTADTVRAAGLGWNPADIYRERAAWGLSDELNDNGNPKKVWLPAGLVIPTFVMSEMTNANSLVAAVSDDQPNAGNGGVVGIRIRRHGADDPRYVVVPGGASVALVAGRNRAAVVVVESALDAILIGQAAGDLVTAVALQSSSARPDNAAWALIRSAGTVLVALDADEAGAKAAWAWWRENLPTFERHPVPIGKDPTDAWRAGLNLRTWVEAGLPDEPAAIEQPAATIAPAPGAVVVETAEPAATMTARQVNTEHRAMLQAGAVPSWYTLPGECARCGPVWLPDWALPKVRECPWCSVRVPFERPASKQARAGKA